MIADMIDTLEYQRATLQVSLDNGKTKEERNLLGQFATPINLAEEIVNFAASLLPEDEEISFLDPAFGTGVFYSALRNVFPMQRIKEAVGIEIDPHYAKPASRMWEATGLDIKLADFTRIEPSPRFNLIICNPPYVRHHHISAGDKARLQFQTYRASDLKIGGLAGLYCYFLGLSYAWMADNGIAGWLIPSEFMDVNYGHAIKHFLLNKVTLLHLHRFDPSEVQFSDALVSSAVIWLRKSPPLQKHTVTFTFGNSLLNPRISRCISANLLHPESKWTRYPLAEIRGKNTDPILADFFTIKRGLVTGDNRFFILNAAEIDSYKLPREVFRPILPSPRYIPNDEIIADNDGSPVVEHQLFLLDTKLTEDQIRIQHPTLFAYLQRGKNDRIHERYVCRHRKPWYSQESRPPAPILCTYLGRVSALSDRPFRFILNNSKATVANVYLVMYPKPFLTRAIESDTLLLRRIWKTLNELSPDELIGEGRVYGGGLHKLEPKELANVDATRLTKLIPDYFEVARRKQLSLFGEY